MIFIHEASSRRTWTRVSKGITNGICWRMVSRRSSGTENGYASGAKSTETSYRSASSRWAVLTALPTEVDIGWQQWWFRKATSQWQHASLDQANMRVKRARWFLPDPNATGTDRLANSLVDRIVFGRLSIAVVVVVARWSRWDQRSPLHSSNNRTLLWKPERSAMRVDLKNQIINEISNDGNDAFAERRWYLSDAIVDHQQKSVQLIELPVSVGCHISVQRRVEIHQFDVTNSRDDGQAWEWSAEAMRGDPTERIVHYEERSRPHLYRNKISRQIIGCRRRTWWYHRGIEIRSVEQVIRRCSQSRVFDWFCWHHAALLIE